MTEGEIFKLIVKVWGDYVLNEIKAGKELKPNGIVTEIIRALKSAGVLLVKDESLISAVKG